MTRVQQKIINHSIVLMIGVFSFLSALAQNDPPYTSILAGDAIKVNSSITVKDTVFFNPLLKPTILRTNSISNIISLRIDEYSNLVLPDSFKVEIKINVVYISKDNLTNTLKEQKLTIYYNKFKPYKSRDIYYMQNGRQVQVKVLSVTANYAPLNKVLPVLILENKMLIDRDYVMNTVSGSQMDCSVSAIKNVIAKDFFTIDEYGEVKISWTPNKSSEKYDVEWTYIDKSALDNGNYSLNGQLIPQLIFKNNATRITTSADTCMIPLLYDGEGSLFFRVRGVQEDPGGELITTLWSSEFVSNGGLGRHDFTGHERALNWQATTSFAEQAKRKSVVQYFDGSLRNRQTVTRDNSTRTTIAAETLYDHQGRPVIQVLPAPTLSTLIGYAPNLNININGTEYDKGNYDTLINTSDYCQTGAEAMTADSGAARYYSPNNPLSAEGIHQFIPNAKGYAFTETQYTQDNTGRINKQGGVGQEFQLGRRDDNGNTHETKYFYGTPEQTDLDALFGTEAGEASHYQKNMVRDANGQYSVSYVDMHGRTIATALAGDSPANLQRLGGYRDSIQSEQLINLTNNIINGISIQSTKSILVPMAGNHDFTYSMGAESLSLKDCEQRNVCYDCLYDLTITITDDCNNQLLGGSPLVIAKSNFNLFEIDTSCNMASPVQVNYSVWLQPGSYNISKELSINREGMQYYWDNVFTPHNSCKSYDDILNEQKEIVRNDISCDSEPETKYEYENYRSDMLMDLYPLIGQYADTSGSRECSSIFDGLEAGERWRSTNLIYLDEEGKKDTVINGEGVTVSPNQLTKEEFITNFKNSWANALLPLHPEYQLLLKYESFSASHQWEEDFSKTETYHEAKARGYLNPAGNTTQQPASGFSGITTDPLYSAYSESSTAKQAIENKLFNFQNIAGVNVSLWGFATAMSKCPDTNPIDQVCVLQWNQAGNPFNEASLCEGELDMAWKIFRTQYLSKKKEWMLAHIRSAVGDPTINIPCIRNFTNAEELLRLEGFELTPQDETKQKGSANQLYANNCRAFAGRWWQQLSGGCFSYTQQDSSIVIDYLIEVCKEGTDIDHPFGSSSVKPGSAYRFRSFEEVINFYNDSTGRVTDINCNSYLIDKPLPYNQSVPLVSKQLFGKPEPCECEKINIYKTQFDANVEQYGTFSNFMQQKFKTRISQGTLDSLFNMCNDISFTCKFIPKPVTLPTVFQCLVEEPCVPCDLVTRLYDSFLVKFSNQLPRKQEPDTLQQKMNQVFVSYMNQQLGFSKSHLDYLDFLDSCQYHTDDSAICADIQSLTAGFKIYYDSLRRINPSKWVWETPFVYLTDTSLHIENGILGPSDIFDCTNGRIEYKNERAFKVENEFGLEFRIRRDVCGPAFSSSSNFYIKPLTRDDNGNNGSEEFYPIFNMGNFGELPGYIFNGGFIADNSFFQSWSDFQTIKYIAKTDRFELYVDGALVKEIDRSGNYNINIIDGFEIDAIGNPELDWVKIYGKNGSLMFEENFDAFPTLQRPDSSYDAFPLICTQEFEKYYNAIKETDYSYREIDSLYFNSCGKHLDVCSSDTLVVTLPPTSGTGNGPLLCGKSEAFDEPFVLMEDDPCADSTSIAVIAATERHRIYKDSLSGAFEEAYQQKCLNAINLESFTVSHPVSEYHYTLYYYDLAGNLIKTIPPEGVHPNRHPQWLQQVKQARNNNQRLAPIHTIPTVYRYNSLNQVVTQRSPDGGYSEFWYDRLGRLAISRNARQKIEGKYSYTLYDPLGRITEVGQKQQSTAMTNAIARNETLLGNWMRSFYRNEQGRWYLAQQVTSTVYDVADNAIQLPMAIPVNQKSYTLRNRVSYTRTYDYLFTTNSIINRRPLYDDYNNSTTFSYDIHGNVDTLLQQYRIGLMAAHADNRFKVVAYKYDLISGKVNQVHYQPDQNDQLYHRYDYDAENRITDVFTTDNKLLIGDVNLEEHDAHYDYYKHGPLVKTVLGHQQVQGINYAYTLQGWLKGVNSDSLLDNDGKPGTLVAKDAYRFSLNYFNGDYKAISYSMANIFPGHTAYMPDASEYKPLYNGNISSMVVAIPKLGETQLYNYGYDQLNRLVSMDRWKGYDAQTGSWEGLQKTEDYKERISYDGNGNIISYLRNGLFSPPAGGVGGGLAMDDMQYGYNKDADGHITNNRLKHVKDAVGNANYVEDIDNQSDDNYGYDAIGNLVRDNAEKITNIEWSVYGKIFKITKTATADGDIKAISYTYDAAGNRISKRVEKQNKQDKYTWYTKDAGGNTMAVYEYEGTNTNNNTLFLEEHHLFGTSRLGIWNRNVNMDERPATTTIPLLGPTYSGSFERGTKFFELSNHLQNVQVIISDKKIGVDANSDGIIDYYNADVIIANDYYPFGSQMPNRKYTASSSSYRYGFNGKEQDPETYGEGNIYDYGFRIYNPRLGKFLSVDPLAKSYPWNSSYAYAENDVIRCIDLDGLEKVGYAERNSANGWVDGALKAPGNFVVQGGNALTWAWNKGVDYFSATNKSDPVQGITEQVSKDANVVTEDVGAIWQHHTTTPAKQQAKEAWSFISNPDNFYNTLEQAALTFTTARMPVKAPPVPAAAEIVTTTTRNLFGGNVKLVTNRTTSVIGRRGDVTHIQATGQFRTGVNNGGVNLLNQKNWSWYKNQQWLQAAIKRGDVIRAVSDPRKIANIWEDGIVGGTRTTFGREVQMLEKAGYRFDAKKSQFIKKK